MDCISIVHRRFFFIMKYIVNLTSNLSRKSRVTQVEAEGIKQAEAKAQKLFSTYTIDRICEQTVHARQYYKAINETRKNKNEEN